MASTYLDTQIRDCISAFVEELSTLVRRAAVESVQEALGTGATSRTKGTIRRKKKATRGARPVRRKGGRRSSESVAATAEAIVRHVRSNPGQNVTEIGDALGLSSKDLRLPIQKLVGEKQLRTTGQRRGTRYHPAGRRGGVRKKAAAPRRKKVTRKKTAKRKAARKRTARKK
jgi:hypothetical protein